MDYIHFGAFLVFKNCDQNAVNTTVYVLSTVSESAHWLINYCRANVGIR